MKDLLRSASNVVLIMMLSLCCATFTSCSSDEEDTEIPEAPGNNPNEKEPVKDPLDWNNVCFDLREGEYSQIEFTPLGMCVLWGMDYANNEPYPMAISDYERVDKIYKSPDATVEVREYSPSTNTAVIAVTPTGGETSIYTATLGDRIGKSDKNYRLFACKWKLSDIVHVKIDYKGKTVYDKDHPIVLPFGDTYKSIEIETDEGKANVPIITSEIYRVTERWLSMSGLEFCEDKDGLFCFGWEWVDKDEGCIVYRHHPDMPKRTYQCEGDKMLMTLEYESLDIEGVVERYTFVYNEKK